MRTTREFDRIRQEQWFTKAISIARRHDLSCFHWELEFPQIFFGEDGRLANQGFDAIVGNPPYDVLSEAETGQDLTTFKSFIAHEPFYSPSRRGKNNLYKLFICRSLELLSDGGFLGYITPMAVLGDDQAADIRRRLVEVGSITGIEAFPQKDNPSKRIFREAKLSTTVVTFQKSNNAGRPAREFLSRVHPGNIIDMDSPQLVLSTTSIPLYDPANFSIVSCSQPDWDLVLRIIQSRRTAPLRNFIEIFQGEINETNDRAKGNIQLLATENTKLVMRGANVCLYVTREPSQGTDIFLNVPRFLNGKDEGSKAFHHRQRRVVWQNLSAQNNFRRLIAAMIPAGDFCNHALSYCPEDNSTLDLRFLLAIFNSKLAEWFFRLGSTNNNVLQYLIYNIPCPLFSDASVEADDKCRVDCLAALTNANTNQVLDLLQPLMANPPFSLVIQSVVIEATNRIIDIETRRGEIARAARSRLSPESQIYQNLIDKLFYQMAGLTDAESTALEVRLAEML